MRAPHPCGIRASLRAPGRPHRSGTKTACRRVRRPGDSGRWHRARLRIRRRGRPGKRARPADPSRGCTAMTSSPRPRCARASASRNGKACSQVGHQEAQKSTSTSRPVKTRSRGGRKPSASGAREASAQVGACRPASACVDGRGDSRRSGVSHGCEPADHERCDHEPASARRAPSPSAVVPGRRPAGDQGDAGAARGQGFIHSGGSERSALRRFECLSTLRPPPRSAATN